MRWAFARLLLAAAVLLLAVVSQLGSGYAGAAAATRPTPEPGPTTPRVRSHLLGYSSDGWPIGA